MSISGCVVRLGEPYLAESQVDFVALALQDDNPYRVVAVYRLAKPSCASGFSKTFSGRTACEAEGFASVSLLWIKTATLKR